MGKFVAAAVAGLAGPAVDPVAELEPAGAAIGVDVIAEGGTAGRDGASKKQAHAADQGLDRFERNVAGWRMRMQATGMQQFIDVNVAQTRDDVLIEQGGFDRPARPGKPLVQLPGGDGQGIGSEACPALGVEFGGFREGPYPAEASRVGKNKLATIVQLPNDVDMRIGGLWRCGVGLADLAWKVAQRPGHAQVEAEAWRMAAHGAGPGRRFTSHQGELLAVPFDRGDALVQQQGVGVAGSGDDIGSQ